MVFKSEAQRKHMFANHPEIAKQWEAETQAAGQPSLPDRVSKVPSAVKKHRELLAKLAKAQSYKVHAFTVALLVLGNAARGITLLWDVPVDSQVDAYYIYSSTNLANWQQVGSSFTNSWSFNLVPSQAYFYVTASNFWGESSASNITNTPSPLTNGITTLKITKQ